MSGPTLATWTNCPRRPDNPTTKPPASIPSSLAQAPCLPSLPPCTPHVTQENRARRKRGLGGPSGPSGHAQEEGWSQSACVKPTRPGKELPTLTMTMEKSSSLSPTAPPYIPVAQRSVVDLDQPQASFPTLLELPAEVIAMVLSKMRSWQDVTSVGLACKALLRELGEAPLTLSFSSSHATMMSSTQAAAYTSGIVSSTAKYAPGLTTLDLSNLHLENTHVIHMCRSLPHLSVLSLAGCKKLTSQLCDALTQAPCELPSPEAQRTDREVPTAPIARLQALDLQRCFQLNAACLSTVLGSCCGSMHLQFLAMSHLDLEQLEPRCKPCNASGTSAPCSPRGSSLRMLALHNCTRLGAASLFALASACPQLQVLLLGGSSFAPQQGPLAACIADIDEHLKLLTSIPPTGTGPLLCAVQAAVETSPAILACQASANKLQQMTVSAVTLVALVIALPDLQALELSFLPPPVVAAASHALREVCPSLGRSPPAVWDLTQEAGVQSALQALQAAQKAELAGGASTAASASGLPAHLLRAALKCAVNCSSSTRTTPLHTAAFSGASAVAEQLLELGAVVSARDVAGATALFLAAEAGQAAAVRKLLAAGGDPAFSNAAGESPLYIAALKGHLEVVRALVEGCVQRRISWHKLRYGDGWTPLMAAALANRLHVAQALLLAAGAEAALDLANAANRYGQSALHIAARKGSPQMLRLLLCVGGAGALAMADASGETPMDVAVKHSHSAAVAEFRRACAHV